MKDIVRYDRIREIIRRREGASMEKETPAITVMDLVRIGRRVGQMSDDEVLATLRASDNEAGFENVSYAGSIPTPFPYLPYLVDRADGVPGHYALGRWHPDGHQQVWNLRSHCWSTASEDVLNREQAIDLLRRLYVAPTRGVTDVG